MKTDEQLDAEQRVGEEIKTILEEKMEQLSKRTTKNMNERTHQSYLDGKYDAFEEIIKIINN